MSGKMKELQLKNDGKGGKVIGQIVDVDIPKPKDNDILIKVVVTGTNPKDWKYINEEKWSNSGDDIAGIVEAVGSKVLGFKKGDRVGAFHVMGDPAGSFAEYAIAPKETTFHIPESISFEQAATIPLVGLTSALALYQRLRLPPPWQPATESIPFVVYGGTTSVGLTALKYARLSNLSPVITVAGGSKDLIEKANLADHVIDYRDNDHIAEDIKKALGGKELFYAFDGITEHPSSVPLAEVLSKDGHLTGILPYKGDLPNGHKQSMTYVGLAHKPYPGFSEEEYKIDKEFAPIWSRYTTRILEEGTFDPHPYEVVKNGLEGIIDGLNQLKQNKVKGKKLVARISETPGL